MNQNIYEEAMGAMSVLAVSKMKDSKLTDEERKANRERYKQLQEDRRIKASIIANVCPDCEGKLVRGKKNKKNEYKRDWLCSSCDHIFSL